VSTNVGGVPEVLPDHMIRFAEPDEDSVFESLIDAFAMLKDVVSSEFHSQMKDMYVVVMFVHSLHSLLE
jgi:phosphatidylinositol glycan class A protein